MWSQVPLLLLVSSSAQGQSSSGKLAYSPPKYPSPWANGEGDWAAAYQKAQAFVRQLTLLEKVNLTTGVGWESEKCVGNTGSVPRLNFDGFCNQDGPLGVRFADYVSAFPAGGTVAASWDREVWRQRGADLGAEHRDKGVDTLLGPVVGPLGRAPEGGRNWEGFSPDPALSAFAVAETVEGIQSSGVIACTKHFIVNEQEHFRQAPEAAGYGFDIAESLSSNVDDKTLHELYLWPFAAAVKANTGSIMCSYNQINNSYGCQNSYLLNHILKDELGFQGFVMSDWQAQHSGAASAFAGLDMAMPGDTLFDTNRTFFGTNLTLAVLNGTIPEWKIDDMVTRIMSAYYFVGRDKTRIPPNFSAWTQDTFGFQHFIAQKGYGLINEHVDVRAEHAKNIRNSAARSIVLLKNNKALPLTGREKRTGVFGQGAVTNIYGPNGCPNRNCDNGTLAMGFGSGTSEFPYLVDPLTAIQNTVLETSGNVIESVADNWATSQIMSVARQSTVALVFVSADSGEGFIDIDGNVGDRKNLTLWHDGEELIKQVASQNNNTIVVIESVGPVLVDSFYKNENVTGILWVGLQGQEAGNSIADVLYGRVNPGGKSPFTWGAARKDYGTDVLYKPNNGRGAPQDDFTEGNFIDYRWFDKHGIKPIYEFGYGLSYTTFTYANLQVQAHTVLPYKPTTGHTKAAPTLGSFSKNLANYLFPRNFTQIPYYIYPFLKSTNAKAASGDPHYGIKGTYPDGVRDGSPQTLHPAGGAPGGNPQLYDILFTVTAYVTNNGTVAGDEVVELYISLGGPNDPKVVLRNFERVHVEPRVTVQVNLDITRKDVSNWDTKTQNWIVTNYPKTVYVGASSRKLYLKQKLVFGAGYDYAR